MKGKPMLLKKLSSSRRYKGKKTIGLLGIDRGVGVTYTGMLMAHFLGNERSAKTAYLECNNHQDFSMLQEAYEWSKEDEYSFSLDRITFYKQVTTSQIPHILNQDYNCYIFDFGTDYLSVKEEFIRCEKKFIIGGSAIWDQSKMLAFIKSMENADIGGHWMYIIPCADQRVVIGMANETGRSFCNVPYEPAPASLSKKTHKLFQSLLD